MSVYILVHGAWHGGWCWEKVVPLLERAGHTVLAPDLPGHGSDRTAPADVTLDAYVRSVGDLLSSSPNPVILVGHSMGGIVISEVAEKHPERVETLVYVAAFLLRDGESLLDIAATDADSTLLANLEWAADGSSATVAAASVRATFYGRCSDADADAATARLTRQPAAPTTTAVHLSAERYGRIPRVYVECLRDCTVSPTMQRAMYEATPCRRVATLDTDHSPFYSTPEQLAAILLSAAK